MAITKTAVFLASRFSEFERIRISLNERISNYPHLHMSAIDLNNGSVSHRPPLKECLGYVKRSEFMILLMGDSYGSISPDSDKSFTHLEYLEANNDDNNTRVLVFGIGDNYQENKISHSADPKLALWQKEVEENHTIGFIDSNLSEEEITEVIFQKLLAAIYEKHFGVLSLDEANNENSLSDEELDTFVFEDSDANAFEERFFREPQLVDDPIETKNTLSAITNPAAITAIEQRKEAKNAIDLGEHAVAIKHLKRALDVKPLDLISNYWLAQLYVSTGKKSNALKAVELGVRSANIATQSNLTYRASAAYLIAARAANLLERNDDAIQYANHAVEVAPNFSRAHIGLARQYVVKKQPDEAVKHLRKAFNIFPKSISEANGDPVFKAIRPQINTMIQELKANLENKIDEIRSIGNEISKITGNSVSAPISSNKTLPAMIKLAKNLVHNQYKLVSEQIIDANTRMHSIDDTVQELPLKYEKFSFKKLDDKATIEKWYIQENDIIKNNDKICEIRFINSRKSFTWSYRGSRPQRIIQLAGEPGVTISTKTPTMYSFVSGKYKINPLSELMNLQKQIDSQSLQLNKLDKTILSNEQNTTARLSKQLRELNSKLFIGVIAFSWVVYAVQGLTIATITFVIGVFILFQLYKAKDKKHHKELQNSLAPLRVQRMQCTKRIAEIDDQINNLKSEAMVTAERAKKALQIFETKTLKKHSNFSSFKTLSGSKHGDIVRVFNTQLHPFEKNSKIHTDVNSLPLWLTYDNFEKSPIHLYKITEKKQNSVKLSALEAYLNK